MAVELQLALLGNLQIRRDEVPVAALRSAKAQALLCYLAVTGRPHLRPRLVGLLWGEMPEAQARNNLSKALTRLRQAVGCHLSITRQTVAFDRDSPYWLDVEIFEARVSGVSTAGTSVGVAPSRHDHADARSDIERLQSAVELYRGDFLEGFYVREALAFEEWVLAQRARLRELALGALHTLAVHHARRGEAGYAAGIDYTSRLLALEPWREAAHRQLMLLLARSGQRGAALAQYETCRQMLVKELGVEPGAETTALYERIRDGTLTKMPEPEPVQIGAGEQSDTRQGAPGLPIPLTRLIGREQELDEIEQLLRDPACRLLTLVGPGGSGKTRLALEAGAARLDDFENGVFFVSLAPLRSADSIEPTVASALGIILSGAGEPHRQLLSYLRDKSLLLILDNFEHLLPPSVPPDGGEGLVIDILKTAPHVKVLTTSRSRLNVRGERIFPVSGMHYPEYASIDGDRQEGIDQYSALELFADSARESNPSFELTDDNIDGVIRICSLVAGMPLGIVLAAAWVEMLTPGEIAGEISQNLDFLETDMRDMPERQRSMRAVFDHSWNLLTERQREVFQALSVFRGGFTRQAALYVSGATLRELKVLVDRSLVHLTPTKRYEMHELLRQYAAGRLRRADRLHRADKLDVSGEGAEAVGDLHCAYYIGVLERWESGLKGDRQPALLTEMRLDIENARAAWDWAATRAEADRLGRAVEGLCRYYLNCVGRFRECEAACRTAAKRLEAEVCADGSAPTRAEGLRVLARILGWQGEANNRFGNGELCIQLALQGLALLDRPELSGLDTRRERAQLLQQAAKGSAPERSGRWLQQALSLWRALEDQHGIAGTLFDTGLVSWRRDPEGAEPFLRESVAICERFGYRTLGAAALRMLAHAFHLSGQFDRAQSLLEERLANYDDLGDVPGSAHRHWNLGLVHMDLGQYQQARAQGQLGLALSRQVDFRVAIARSLTVLACVALAEAEGLVGAAIPPGKAEGGEVRKRYAEAQRLAQESVTYIDRLALRHYLGIALAILGVASRGFGELDEAGRYLADALAISAEIGVVMTLVHPLSGIALLLADAGEHERAVELYALASRYPLVANSRWFEDVFGRHIEAVAATLSPEVAEAARERGRARDLGATVKELLAELSAWDSQYSEPSQL